MSALAGLYQSHQNPSTAVAGGAKESRDEGVEQSASLLDLTGAGDPARWCNA